MKGCCAGKGRSLNETERAMAQEYIKQRVEQGDGGCWLWMRGVSSSGYGFGAVPGSKPQQVMAAHRLSYLAFVGDLLDGQIVMHSCDVPRCVNPKHLKAGTQRENLWDASGKGRLFRTKHPRSAKIGNRFAAVARVNGETSYLGMYGHAEIASAVAAEFVEAQRKVAANQPTVKQEKPVHRTFVRSDGTVIVRTKARKRKHNITG